MIIALEVIVFFFLSDYNYDQQAMLFQSDEQLSADDLRILSIVLVEYLDKLKEFGLNFETAVAS